MPEIDPFELCRRLTAKHGKTYYFSTQFFPPEVRRSVFALYGFVRCPDEIVDNPVPGSDAMKELLNFRNETRKVLNGSTTDNKVLVAFAETVRKHDIPHHYPMAFLDAMEMDLFRTRYDTFESLRSYTFGSASVVGLMMCHILNADVKNAYDSAYDLGLAMQMTNFLRDIGEDWVNRGRIYLPLEDLERFGYSEDNLADGVVNDRFRELMRFEIDRTRQLYESADRGLVYIPKSGRLPVRLARLLYSRILDKIEDNDYDVFRNRASTSGIEKLFTALTELFRQQQLVKVASQALPSD